MLFLVSSSFTKQHMKHLLTYDMLVVANSDDTKWHKNIEKSL